MTNRELTPFETLMQDIGLALLKFTDYELGTVNISEDVDIEVKEDSEQEIPAPKKRGRKPKVEPDEEADDDTDDESDGDGESDDDDNEVSEADLKGKTLRQLRIIAVKMGFDKDEVANADKEALIDSILNPEDDDEDEDDDDDESDDSSESEGIDAEKLTAELEKMTLSAVKKVARDEYGFKAPDYKGLDKDSIIELILEKATDSDIEDDEDEDDEPYTEDELEAMSMAELKAICKEWGIKIKVGEKKPTYVEAILEAQD